MALHESAPTSRSLSESTGGSTFAGGPPWFTEARVALVAKAMAIAFLLAGLSTFLLMRDMMLSPDRGLGGDFLGVYAAGVLAREGEPAKAYDLDTIVATEHRVLPQVDYVLPWPYPPVFQVVALPLTSLPYVWAYALWAALLLALYIATWRRAFGVGSAAFWLAIGSSAVYVNVLHGQNGLLNASLVSIGLLALRARPLLAGIAIGALCYKPQIGLPIGILLLATGQWRAVGAAALSVALLCGASAAVLGLDVWRAFLENGAATRALLENAGLPLSKLGTVFSFARLLGTPPTPAYVLQGIVALVALALAIQVWRRPGDETAKLALAAATVPLVPPYLFDYDFAILVLPIGLLLIDGFRNGWMPWVRPVLLLAWLAPAAAPGVATALTVQILPLVSIALLWVAWRRCRRGAAHPGGRLPFVIPSVAREPGGSRLDVSLRST